MQRLDYNLNIREVQYEAIRKEGSWSEKLSRHRLKIAGWRYASIAGQRELGALPTLQAKRLTPVNSAADRIGIIYLDHICLDENLLLSAIQSLKFSAHELLLIRSRSNHKRVAAALDKNRALPTLLKPAARQRCVERRTRLVAWATLVRSGTARDCQRILRHVGVLRFGVSREIRRRLIHLNSQEIGDGLQKEFRRLVSDHVALRDVETRTINIRSTQGVLLAISDDLKSTGLRDLIKRLNGCQVGQRN